MYGKALPPLKRQKMSLCRFCEYMYSEIFTKTVKYAINLEKD